MVDMSPELTDKQKNYIQKVCGKFLYNGRGVDVAQPHSLNKLSIKATEAIEETQKQHSYNSSTILLQAIQTPLSYIYT